MAPLADLGKWFGGGTPSKSNPAFWAGGSIPWVSPKDMKVSEIHDAEDHITQEAVDSSATNVVPAGAVLIVTRSGILRHSLPVAVTRTRAAINQDIKALVPFSGIEPTYVAYALRAFEYEILSKTSKSGTTVQSIEFPELVRFGIPIAPEPEQTRIVDEIEKHLTRLDAATGLLKRIQANLKRYRAAVLKAACEGWLVPTEAQVGMGAERVFDSQETGDHCVQLYRLPQGWKWVRLASLISEGPQNGLYLPKELYGSGTPIIRIDDFQDDYSRASHELLRVMAREREMALYSLKAGDILINRVNSPSHLGKCLFVTERHLPALFESNMMRFRVVPQVNSLYLVTYLRSPLGRRLLTAGAKWAVNQASINQRDVGRTWIPLPPRIEQERIVVEVNRRMSLLDDIKASVLLASTRAARLRQSILRCAFQGRLVYQDPSAEPASVLLERISQEKQKQCHDSSIRRPSCPAPMESKATARSVRLRKAASMPRSRSGRNDASIPLSENTAPSELLRSGEPMPRDSRPGKRQGTIAGFRKTLAREGSTGSFTDFCREQRVDAVWESLFGLGALERDDAVRTVAEALRDRGLARFQRLRSGWALYETIEAALALGLRAGDFDRPRRGYVRAVLRDPQDYSIETWSFCLLESFDHRPVEESEALRAAAEWARENLGLEYGRLREDGVILRGLRQALKQAIRRGEIVRVGRDGVRRA